jgi:hypothetical protein
VRIRIKKPPKSPEIAEFDKRAFAVGKTVEVSARLATFLIVEGYAEPVMERSEAADADNTRRKKP